MDTLAQALSGTPKILYLDVPCKNIYLNKILLYQHNFIWHQYFLNVIY
jgi:hypothetical protein